MTFERPRWPLHGLIALPLLLMLACNAHAQLSGHEYYERALSHFETREFPAAIVELKNTLRVDPNFLPAHTLLARIFLRMGAASAAAEAINRARELGADPTVTWPLQALAMLQQAKFAEILKIIPSQGLTAAVQSRLLVIRGHAQTALGRIEEAQGSYTEAAALAPKTAEPLVAMAKTALLSGDFDTARRRALHAVEVVPKAADTWNVKGDVLQASGELDAALVAYETALAREPGHLHAQVSRTGILIALGRMVEAKKAIEVLEDRVPNEPRLHYLKSVYHTKQGQPEEAQSALARAAGALEELGEDIVRGSGQLLMLAGVVNLRSDRVERAQTYLEYYNRLYPNRLDALAMLAGLALKRGKTLEAIRMFEEVLSRASPTPMLLSRLAQAYAKEQRHDVARGYLEKALTMAPENPDIQIQVALNQLHTGREDAGVESLTRLFQEAPIERQKLGARIASLRLRRGEFEAALAVVRRLLEQAPQEVTYLNLLGTALMGAGDPIGARIAFEEAVNLDATYIPAQLNLSKLIARQGAVQEAKAVLELALEGVPGDLRLMLELAALAVRMDDEAEALRWLEKARSEDARSEGAAIALSDLHLANGRPEEALAVAEEALAWSPESLDLLRTLAGAQLALGRRDHALSLYTRISRNAGFDAKQQYRVAQLQAEVGALQDALYSLSKGLKDHPLHLPSRVLEVELLSRAGKSEQALEAAQALRTARPGLAVAHLLEGRMLAARKRYTEAKAALERAQGIQPSARHVISLAQVLKKAGEPADGTRVLMDWLRGNPGDAVVETALAEHYLADADFARSQAHFENAIDNGGETPELLNNLAYVLAKQGNPSALAVARRAYESKPESAAIADTLGWILVQQGQPGEGLRYLREANARVTSDPDIHFHIAQALSALGRDESALAEVRSALELSTDFASVKDARALFERLSK